MYKNWKSSAVSMILFALGMMVITTLVYAEDVRLNRPKPVQIGVNFVCFYWTDTRTTALNTNTTIYQPEAIFQDFRELGVQAYRQFVKADLLWNIIEPQDDQWNFSGADGVLKNPDFEPIVTLFMMQYASPTPPWTKDPAQFQKQLGEEAREYLTTVVQRYAPYVTYWELGNEMNHWRAADPNEQPPTQGTQKRPGGVFPRDGYSPRDQGMFLKQAAEVIRQNDPDAKIVMPGVGGLDDYVLNTWLAGVIEGGGTEWFDVVNYHYYPSWEPYSIMRTKLQEALKRYGIDQKPVWLTETGSTASPTLTLRTKYPNSPTSQAADIFRRIIQAYGHGDQLVIWHTYIGSPDEPNNLWRLYGIRTDDGTIQPAYYAFKLLTQELLPFQQVEKLSGDPRKSNVYKITTPAGAVKYVVWGNGQYAVPEQITQMTSVIPQADGSFHWQSVQPQTSFALKPEPVLLK